MGTKKQNGNNYLKIGDKQIEESEDTVAHMVITKEELNKRQIEATGNGIFALGRAIAKSEEHKMSINSEIILVLNKNNLDSFYTNTRSSLKGSMVSFATSCGYTMLSAKVIKQHEDNKSGQLEYFNDTPAGDILNHFAVPSINDNTKRGQILKVSKINGDEFVTKHKRTVPITDFTFVEVTTAIKDYTTMNLKSHIDTVADRYKSYIKLEADEAGIGMELFKTTLTYIETWRTSELTKTAEYTAMCRKNVKMIMGPAMPAIPIPSIPNNVSVEKSTDKQGHY